MNRLLTTLFLACVSGCISSPDPPEGRGAPQTVLNSERIRQQFGSYGIDVLEDGDRVRVSSLYSMEGRSKVTRTLAVVIYPSSVPADLLPTHLEVKSGGSIGEVFAQRGWEISKQNLYFGELPVSDEWTGVYALMGGIAAEHLAVHIYQFDVSREGERFQYATIAEVHHPEYLDMAKLEAVYGSDFAAHRFQDASIRKILQTVMEAVLRTQPPVKKAA